MPMKPRWSRPVPARPVTVGPRAVSSSHRQRGGHHGPRALVLEQHIGHQPWGEAISQVDRLGIPEVVGRGHRDAALLGNPLAGSVRHARFEAGTIDRMGAAGRPPEQAVLLLEVTANGLGSHIQMDGMFGHFEVSIPAGRVYAEIVAVISFRSGPPGTGG